MFNPNPAALLDIPGADEPLSAIIPERETIWSWTRTELENKYVDAEDTARNGGSARVRQAAAVLHENPPNRLVAALDERITRRIEHFTQHPPENMQWTFSVLAWGMEEAGIRNLFRADTIRAADMLHQAVSRPRRRGKAPLANGAEANRGWNPLTLFPGCIQISTQG